MKTAASELVQETWAVTFWPAASRTFALNALVWPMKVIMVDAGETVIVEGPAGVVGPSSPPPQATSARTGNNETGTANLGILMTPIPLVANCAKRMVNVIYRRGCRTPATRPF